ncbi:hemolysin family protein [Isoptericola sp. 4D.3]|uniref:Hemolysin family protein n=1 Tax=Isoptericola peretonis TaxID=2918523 RepID=A0ABT0J0K0_9MICO|nr:hemolysin family protein [Isoptericola sp. 4D.3]
MSNPWVVAAATVVIIALSAFFVAVEFALLGARRHRLEDAAPRSRSARAALRSSSELTLLLAGSQLGITACTLALGAVTKPAVHHWLTPLFAAWGAPYWVADVAGFVLALILVTFLHLVVGEMAPKSWAIAHPEASATLLALPMRGFMWLTRPVLRWLNGLANRCLRAVGVEPVDHIEAGHDPATLRHLVEHSANVGALDAAYSSQIAGALELETLTVDALVPAGARATAVPAGATAADVRAASVASGHLRILLREGGTDGDVTGVVHVRDTLLLDDDTPVATVARAPFVLDASTTVHAAIARLREAGEQLALVRSDGRTLGVVTLADVLRRLLPRAEEATAGTAAAG